MSGGKRCQTTGYWYRMGIHFGVCLGPVDALRAIRIGERDAWAGNQTGNGTISINQPTLFGGEEREGGVSGDLDVMMGGAMQTANAYLATRQGTPQPAYRGILSAVFKGGRVAANNPYIKPWAFLVRRTLAGWSTAVWYPAKAEIVLPGGERAMNPAHIVYECLTNSVWGMGYNPGLIDTASFQAAADTFHAEGLGLCIQWSRQDSIEAFVQVVADHAGMVVGQDRRTGLFVLRPIRGGYSLTGLPMLDPSNIIELTSYERAATAEAVNEITVTYADLARGGQKAAVTVQDLAAIQSQGAVVAQTRDYPGLPTHELAARIAERDLRAAATPLARLRLTVNRSAWSLLPGDVARLSWPALGISGMPIRVLSVDYGDLVDGAIRIEAAEDIYGLPATSHVAQQPGLWIAPSKVAVAAPHVETWEATYYDLVQAYGVSIGLVDATTCHLIAAAAKPPGLAVHYELRTRVGSAPYGDAGTGEWSPTAVLASGIGPATTTLTLSGGSLLDVIPAGVPAILGGEIVRVVAVDASAGTMTVQRGCIDTVPASWPAGTRLWIWHGYGAYDPAEYAPSEVVQSKIITVTTADRLAESAAPSDSLTMTGRQARPYPPGRLRINGAAWPSTITGELTIQWAHRDRITQSDQLIDQEAGSIGPEPGTTYTIRLYAPAGTLRRTVAGLTGTSYTWTTEAADSGLPPGTYNSLVRIELESVRDGLASHTRYDVTVTRS